jgi:hypothetical protein
VHNIQILFCDEFNTDKIVGGMQFSKHN